MNKGLKLILLSFLVTVAVEASAQNRNTHPWISKDVQKVANKKMLNDENVNASHINTHSVGYPAVALSKDVHRAAVSSTQAKGNIVSKGYPEWTISKGVQRVGRK